MTDTTLLVPRHLRALATQCSSLYGSKVAVKGYNTFSEQVFDRLKKERLILVASQADFLAHYKAYKKEKLRAALQGKVLLEAPPGGKPAKVLSGERGVDFLASGEQAANWVFRVNKMLVDLDYETTIDLLHEEVAKKEKDLNALNEIGVALSTEKDLGSLLDLIVLKSREMTSADGGSLYLIESDPNIAEDPNNFFVNKKMRFQVAQNDSRDVPFRSFLVDIKKSSIYGYVALTQEYLNFDDVYFIGDNNEYGWGGKEFDASIGYRTKSLLTVPMVNWRGDTIGVIQLVNRKTDPKMILGDPKTCVDDIVPFTERDVQMAMSISSQASIAIQNTQLVSSIKGLFEGFIGASVKAIESRDPTTSGHSQRVATLTVALAEKVDSLTTGRFRGVKFTPEMLNEVRYASLLHDFGKIGVREHVLIKAKKLYPEELQAVRDRFELIRRTIALEHTENQIKQLISTKDLSERGLDKLREELGQQIAVVDELMQFILQCNEPTVLAGGGFERLKDIAARSFINAEGKPVAYINEKELISLSVPKGSLNENDRKEIESHVTHTYKFLTTIPWTGELRNVPDIAYAHHEKLDGTGYPNRLKENEIPVQSKMMTISDIYDALTAMDRPYKKALPAERALNILVEETKAYHVDKDLLDIFIGAELYKIVNQAGPD